jgi:WD40-like Beta Propeller Repeat
MASTPAATGSTQLASSTAGGTPGNASSTTCAVSADGNKVLFSSDASNLVPGDSNRTGDLFLKDLVSGSVIRVTTQSNGAQITAGGYCLGTTMTPDGRIVAFNSGQAVFAKNTQRGLLTLASPPAGTAPPPTGFFGGVVSDDGTQLVFMTLPETVHVRAHQWIHVIPARLLVRDLVSGSTVLVSSSSEGEATGGVRHWNPTCVSTSQVAFGTGQPSGLGEAGLYLKDLSSGELTLLLGHADGGASAVLSGQAQKVVFQRVVRSQTQVFVRDRSTGMETLASANAGGVAGNGIAAGPRISREGTRVVFGSNSRNLVSPLPPADVFQIYAKHLAGAGGAQQ